MSTSQYTERWHWSGRAIVIAPDFLHELAPGDEHPRAKALVSILRELGYPGDSEGVQRFQREHGLGPTGRLDWRTILVLDSLEGLSDRASISTDV